MFFRCNCFRPVREICCCSYDKNYSYSQDNKDYSYGYQSRSCCNREYDCETNIKQSCDYNCFNRNYCNDYGNDSCKTSNCWCGCFKKIN